MQAYRDQYAQLFKDGQERARLVGLKPKAEIQRQLETVLAS